MCCSCWFLCDLIVYGNLWCFVMVHDVSSWFMMCHDVSWCFVMVCDVLSWFMMCRDVSSWFMMCCDVLSWFVMCRDVSSWFVMCHDVLSWFNTYLTIWKKVLPLWNLSCNWCDVSWCVVMFCHGLILLCHLVLNLIKTNAASSDKF